MLRTLGVVDVPPPNSSANLALNTLVARNLGGKPLLEWIVRRLTDAMLLEQVAMIAVGPDHARWMRRIVPANAAVFTADETSDPIARLASAVREYGADAIVRVPVDHAFVDPALVDRLIAKAESHRHCDYLSYCSTRGGSALLKKLGVVAEWFRAETVQRADQEARFPDEREDLSRFVRSHPELFQLRLLPLPERLDRDDLRLAISGEDDWDHAQMILDALGPDNLEWQQIAKLLDEHPALRERMAVLNGEACVV
jgi:spore coat polysaccharide biosynthesis protein SpsF